MKEKDEFANLMVEKTKKLKMGNGMDKDTLLGPLCTKERLEGVEKLVETTKKEGGKILLGGRELQILIKVITMNQPSLITLKIILL